MFYLQVLKKFSFLKIGHFCIYLKWIWKIYESLSVKSLKIKVNKEKNKLLNVSKVLKTKFLHK